MIDRLSVARVAAGLGTSWHTANNAVLAAGRELLISDPSRLDGVGVLGVDEHCWRHARRGDKFVTVIIDLTPVRGGTGPARLLDMVEGRSKAVFTHWLDQQSAAFRDGTEQDTCGHRGRAGDPLYGIRRVLRTGADLLTDKQRARLTSVFANEHTSRSSTRSAQASPPSCPN